jgi:AcrR family transcriptional regulator
MRTRRRLPPEERRRQLIDAAIELYSRRPFEQVSVEDIAEAADVSRALFYRYFSGPADLFGAASRVAIDSLVARLTAPRQGTPEEQLRAGVAEYIDFVEQHSTAFVAVVRNSSAISADTKGLVEEVRLAIVDVIKTGAGLTGPMPLIDLTIWCWTAAMEEATLNWLRDPLLDKDALVTWMSGQLVAMLTATGQFLAP